MRISCTLIGFLLILCFKANAESNFSLIDENKVWEYVTHTFYTSTLEKYIFAGTEVVDNQTYHKLTLIRRTSYDNFSEDIEITEPNNVIALLRETEDGKVYKLIEEGTYREFDGEKKILSKNIFVNTPMEILLYDFKAAHAKFSSCISLFMEDQILVNNILANCRVSRKEKMKINNQYVDKLILSADVYPWCMEYMIGPFLQDQEYIGNPNYIDENYKDSPYYDSQTAIQYIEGIGNIGGGDMINIHPFNPLFLTSGLHDYCRQTLNNVYNSDGEIIYKGANYSFPTYASITDLGKQANDLRIFDLFGREISNPLPGTIYIRNGKKFIAK